jgi:uracil-DNA glycosylase family 4
MLHTFKQQKFDLLIDNVSKCTLCDRMCGRTKVLSKKNGTVDTKILFIGEAPGRLGADRTGIPFYGDQAGRNFERLLQAAGLTRQQIFITNAVLCNPRDERGNNSPPKISEVRNCSLYLSILINIIEPELIVALGRYALLSLFSIETHKIELRQDVRKQLHWSKYTVVPMYHPGPRSAIFRSMNEQQKDFSFLGEMLRRR